jgi:hypothetical protein
MKCATDPEVETNLRCGKCGKPICPKCMVQTPVGARCPDCAKLYKLPTFRVSTAHYLRASGAALVSAIVAGFAWGAINLFISVIYLNLILAGGIGYAIGEVVSWSVNRKRGWGLAVIAGTAVVLSYAVNIFSFGHPPFGPGGVNLFRLIYDIVAIGAGVYFAVNRMR